MARAEKAPSYDLDELQAKYPSLKTLAAPTSKASERAWVAAFTHRPHAMEQVLSDLIKHAYAKPGRIGQRPMPKESEVDLHALIHGEYTEEPLIKILPTLHTMSERQLVLKLRMNRRTFQRIMAGELHPDMELVARIAKVVNKPAAFFLEYRQMAAQAAFIQLITDRPGIATNLYRNYLDVTKSSPFLRPPR